jgi:hypothetical protein
MNSPPIHLDPVPRELLIAHLEGRLTPEQAQLVELYLKISPAAADYQNKLLKESKEWIERILNEPPSYRVVRLSKPEDERGPVHRGQVLQELNRLVGHEHEEEDELVVLSAAGDEEPAWEPIRSWEILEAGATLTLERDGDRYRVSIDNQDGTLVGRRVAVVIGAPTIQCEFLINETFGGRGEGSAEGDYLGRDWSEFDQAEAVIGLW